MMRRGFGLPLIAAVMFAMSACGGGGGGGGGGNLMAFMPPDASGGSGEQGPSNGSESTGQQGSSSGSEGTGQTGGGTNPGSGGEPIPYRVFANLASVFWIASFSNPDPAPGEVVDFRILKPFSESNGAQPIINMLSKKLGYDATNDRLYVTLGPNLRMISNASHREGSFAGGSYRFNDVTLSNYTPMAYDAKNDVIWLITPYLSRTILMRIENIAEADSEIGFSAKTPGEIGYQAYYLQSSLREIAVDPERNIIYGSTPNGIVAVYEINNLKEVELLNGGIDWDGHSNLADRNLFLGGNISDISVDPIKDRMYLVNSMTSIVVLNGASSASGSSSTYQLSIPGAVSANVDAKNDRLYVGGNSNNAYILNNASVLETSAINLGTSVRYFGDETPGANFVWGFGFPQ